MQFYVYALIDPKTNKPFYIGKGKDDRIKQHFSEAEEYRGISDISSAAEIDENDLRGFTNIDKLARIRELFSEGYKYQDIARIMAKTWMKNLHIQ